MAELRRDEGVVLSREDYMETDLLVTLFTRNHGKLLLVAKRARRPSMESGAYLDLTHRVEVIYSVRGELPLLKEVSLLRAFPRIREEAKRAEAALEGFALVRDLLPWGQAQPKVYALVLIFLQTLEGGAPPRRVLLGFLLHLMELLGYGPHLEGCVGCGATNGITWSAKRGGLLCRTCGGEGEEVSLPFWRYLLAFQKLPVWAAGRVAMPEEDVDQALSLLRAFLSYQIRR